MKYIQILAGSTDPLTKDWGLMPYIFISIGNTIWPIAWIYINEHKINIAEVTMIRGITCIVVNYLMCRWLGIDTDFKNPLTFKVLTTRSLLMGVHSFAFALSQYILPLPIVHTISCSGTLFVFLIDFLMNHVRINVKQAVGIAIGFLGSLIAINGRILTKMIDPDYEYKTTFQNYITDNTLLMSLFSVLFLGAMALWAFGIVITKKASANTFQINYILGLSLLFCGACVYPFLQSHSTPLELFISVFTTGLPLVFGQWFFIASLTMTKNTGVLNMMNFLTIFIGFLISLIRYRERPNFITVVGIGLVFLGVWKTVFNKEVAK